MKKILVTGATGFIGQHLCEKLLQQGYDVRAISRRGNPGPLVNLPSAAQIDWRTGDLTRPESLLQACEGMNAIIHAGAMRPIRGTGGFETHNIQGTANLVNALKALPASQAPRLLIFISSLAAGGPTPDGKALREETDPDAPISAYGRSKLDCEKTLKAQLRTVPWISLRPPSVYGPGDDAMFAFYRLISKGIAPLMMPRGPAPDKSLSLIHVHDLSDQIIQVLQRCSDAPLPSERIFYVTSQDDVQVPDLTQSICKALDKTPRTLKVRPWMIDLLMKVAKLRNLVGLTKGWNTEKITDLLPDRWSCSSARFRRTFGTAASTPLETGIQATAAWYKSQKWL